ncbi:MAG TPA: OsmC family protein [Verrucomicrobiae bacterium]|nr:OsmC family protein [Verrucomicrobiae bacterium]
MGQYKATISWQRKDADFVKGKYSREHTWAFDGGVTVPASSSPHVVPTPWSNPANVDPEEAFVAAISSCHMLTYLYLAGKEGFLVESYRDEATGVMTKNEHGAQWMSEVTLHPCIIYGGAKQPTPADVERLHHESHEQCYIANSVKTRVTVAP